MEFLIGILCGILLSVLFGFGPAFFGLIQNSVQYGFRKASFFVVGVFLSDVVVVFLMLVVLKNVDMEALLHNEWVAGVGGACLIAFGIYTFCKHVKAASGKRGRLRFQSSDNPSVWRLGGYGFLLNILNPMVWIYWMSVVALLSGEMELGVSQRYVFFAGLLLALFGTELLKCRLASLLQTWITAPVLNITNKVLGVVLVAFGIYLIVAMVLYRTNPKVVEREQKKSEQSSRIIQSLHNHIAKDSAKGSGDTVYFR